MIHQANAQILVVDDRRENLLAMRSVFEGSPFEVLTVTSGEEALRYLLKGQCSVIIMDVQMPGLDGFETARIIKSRERTKHIPIIFVTAIDRDVEHVLTGYQVGGIDYISKPFDPRVLVMKIQRLVEEFQLRMQLKLQADTLTKQSHDLIQSNGRLHALTDELRTSEALARLIADTSIDAIVTLAESGSIINANPATSMLYGMTHEELVGQHVAMLVPGVGTDPNAEWWKWLQTGKVTQTVIHTDQVSFPAEVQLGEGSVNNRRVFACTIRDVSERIQYVEKLKYQAFHDSLTGLPNRTYLYDLLTGAVTEGDEPDTFFLCLLDIDHFKHVNDTLGHSNGDRLLVLIANELSRHFSDSATAVARLGGDEFAVVVRLSQERSIDAVVYQILEVLRSPFEVDGHLLRISPSIGVAVFPEHGRDINTLLQRADIAMYVAKRNKSSYSVYSDVFNEFSIRKLTLLSDLKATKNMDDFVVYFQPKINLETRRIIGVEALMRWKHPVYGFVPPEEFIPLIEENGQISDFSFWILRESVSKLHELESWGIDIGISVNLSARDLLDARLPRYISGLLSDFSVSANRLTLELTEGSMMSEIHNTLDILHELNEIGVRMSVDDFGTGYSSLSYLSRLPVSELKIDKSFVVNMKEESNDELIVRSITSLAHGLKLDVVAEGVESANVLNRLKRFGVNIAQGFFVSKPLPLADLQDFLNEYAASAE